MGKLISLVLAMSAVLLTTAAFGQATRPASVRVIVTRIEQEGVLPSKVPEGTNVLSNEPNGKGALLKLHIDLGALHQSNTPRAYLRVGLERIGEGHATDDVGVLHAFGSIAADADKALLGTTALRPGGTAAIYLLDVTAAIDQALRKGQKAAEIELRLTGAPHEGEIYRLMQGRGGVNLEVATDAQHMQDLAERLAPISRGEAVYHESCFPIAELRGTDVPLRLLYPAERVIEVVANGSGQVLKEGTDWVLRDGTLILPAGTHAPVQLKSEFFAGAAKPKTTAPAAATRPESFRLEGTTFYHQRQIEVSYVPAKRDWSLPAAKSSLDDLPRLKRLLAQKAPVSMILFGDSISEGFNSSKTQNGWPFQPPYGELVAWGLHQEYGNKITFMNHAKASTTSTYGVEHAETQVGWFKPDLVILAFGMNDRPDARRAVYRQNLEAIIKRVRAVSPETEFILVASMLNNPEHGGLEAVHELEADVLKIHQPGVAYVDMTSTHDELLKHKNYLDLSGNGFNHPNDFLHRIYAQRILEVLIPGKSTGG